MDVLRSCYAARFVFDPTRPDLRTNVEWFFCKPGAKVFPGYHRFASTHYDSEHDQADRSLGEVEHDFPPWRNGRWKEVARETRRSDTADGFDYAYVTYERAAPDF